nr:hypothetical protein [Rhizobium laguerreae]
MTLLFLPALYVAWFRIKPEDHHGEADSKPHDVEALLAIMPAGAFGG